MPGSQDRRLAAILFTDIVGSTSATAESVDAAVALRDRHREIARNVVAAHGGRVVEAPGDETLSVFSSALGAAKAALEIREQSEKEEGELALHFGLHLGEILFRDGEVIGDGVNIASRVCGLSDPSEVLATEELIQAIRGLGIGEAIHRGTHELANVGRPVSVYAIGEAASAREPTGARRRYAWWAAAAGMAALVGGLLLRAPWEAPPPALQTNVVAVFPFNTRGSGDVEYLGEGLVDLLSAKLDAGEELRSVAPHSLLARVAGESATTPDRAARVAASFGASRFVLGSAVHSGDELQLDASLYGTGSAERAIHRVSAAGDPDDLIPLVDRVAARLLPNLLTGGAWSAERVQRMPTQSLPALQAYLVGMRRLRRGEFALGLEELQRAIEFDPDFAIAHFRLAMTLQGSVAPGDEPRRMASLDAIQRLAPTLSARDRRLFSAFHAYATGDILVAEELLSGLLPLYPDDFAVRWLLAETLFHFNPFRGRSVEESRTHFERASELDPSDPWVAQHLLEFAVAEKRPTPIISERLAVSEAIGGRTKLDQQLLAAGLVPGNDLDTLTSALRERFPGIWVGIPAIRVASFGRFPLARSVLAAMSDSSDPLRLSRIRRERFIAASHDAGYASSPSGRQPR